MTTKIEWCDETVNPIRAKAAPMGPGDPENMRWEQVGWHCERVDEGCRHCYAAKQNRNGARGGTRLDYEPTHFDQGRVEVFLDEAVLAKVLGMRKPRAIFWCSMTDLFGRFVTDEQRDRAFATMALTPQHRHIVLTKRAKEAGAWLSDPGPERRGIMEAIGYLAQKYLDGMIGLHVRRHATWPLPNVYIGTSVSDQASADARLPDLLRIAALGWKVWVSYEPALGAVEWGRWVSGERESGPAGATYGVPCPRISGLVCGGESGPGARPMHPDWARAARDACAAAGVPFHFKQWGGHFPLSEYKQSWPGQNSDIFNASGKVTEVQTLGERFLRVGKKKSGRLLDGQQHDALAWRAL